MVPDRQGYRSLQLEECEFLIAETPEGRLDLRDAYVTTDVGSEEPSYRRVEGLEGITGQPQAYQEVPWYSEYPGDAINNTPAKIWVWRIFLVPIVAEDPEDEVQLAFENIWVLDGKTASLKQCEVQRLAPPDTPPQDLRLRIRDDVVTIDTSESLPEWEYAVQARRNGVPALSELEQERLKQYLSSLEEAYKQGAIDEMDYATAKDVHWLAALQAGGEGLPALNGSWEPSSTAGVEAVSFGPPNQQEEVSGPWELDGYGDEELLVDMMPQYDDEAEEEGEYDDFDSPAADY